MMLPVILWLLMALPAGPFTVSTVPCKSVADCWLDEDGRPIARPKDKRGRKVPRGDCGKNLRWLRHWLQCQDSVCVTRDVGDRC